MPGPLSGFRVLDLSAVVSGPLCAALLADQGADVIKVERTSGDIQRHVGSQRNGFSGFFHVLNRGKKSIALDLSQARGQEIVRLLAADVDVVVQNFRPGVVDRLGIDYSRLAEHNPGLVYLSISGFGQTGPRAADRAYDPIIQAYSGIAQVQGRIHDDNPHDPEQVNMLLLDKLTAHTGAQAITAALLARSKTGRGQEIELSMLDTAVAFCWADVAADLILQPVDDPAIVERPPIGASGHLTQFADGWGATMTLSDAEFQGMCTVYDLPELAADPRFATLAERMNHREEYRAALLTIVNAAAARFSLAEAQEQLSAAEVPFAPVLKLAELAQDPQIQHNALFRDITHPTAGKLREARPAALFKSTTNTPSGPAPDIGQHTEQVLASIGLQDQLPDLRKEGIIL